MTEQEPSPTGRPNGKQLAWMIGGGIILAIGGCGFYLFGSRFYLGDPEFGAVAFVVGVLFCLAGCVRWWVSAD